MKVILNVGGNHTINLSEGPYGELVGDCGVCIASTHYLELQEHKGICCSCYCFEFDKVCKNKDHYDD